MGPGLGARLNPARNNGKRASACATFDAFAPLAVGLACVSLSLSRARPRARVCDADAIASVQGQISRSARRLMESCQSPGQPGARERACAPR